MRRFLLFRSLTRLPQLVRLSFRLVRDPRVPTQHKAMALGTIALILSPLDLPGWIPVVGQGLDAIVIAAILDRFVKAAPAEIVREHAAALGLRGEFEGAPTHAAFGGHMRGA